MNRTTIASILLVSLVAVGCSGTSNTTSTNTGGLISAGGTVGTGGTKTIGGSSTLGGSSAKAGSSSMGGGISSGGASPVGGNAATGGTKASAGAGGTVSTGGVSIQSGGTASTTGGAIATGGKIASGGITGNGGSVAPGGTKSTAGGNSGTGGTVTGGVGGTGGSLGTGGAGGCGNCQPGFGCCNDSCVNLNNDINNCGTCGVACSGPHPFCDNGTCGTPSCTGAACASSQFCCGDACCATGQLCCNVPGPVVSAVPQCVTPVGGTCPVGCSACVCASPDTLIATPGGVRPIVSLREGDLVFSVDHGQVVAVPVLKTKQIAVSNRHVVVRVALENGTVLEISAPHPTADGRQFGDLRAGSQLGGIRIAKVEVIPYGYDFTYDILPASDSGTYFAGGALVGSTLAAPVDLAMSVAVP